MMSVAATARFPPADGVTVSAVGCLPFLTVRIELSTVVAIRADPVICDESAARPTTVYARSVAEGQIWPASLTGTWKVTRRCWQVRC